MLITISYLIKENDIIFITNKIYFNIIIQGLLLKSKQFNYTFGFQFKNKVIKY